MITALRTDITVADICDGFVYNTLEGKGLLGWPESSRFSRSTSATTSMPMAAARERRQ